MKPGVTSRFAQSEADVLLCQALRYQSFRGAVGFDLDKFDEFSQHVMIEMGDDLLGTMRLRILSASADLNATYTGSFYGIDPIGSPSLEIGRFCVAPTAPVAEVLRTAWTVLTRLVDAEGVKFIFGCASFEGTDPARYADVFALLLSRYQGEMPITAKASETKRFADVQAPQLNAVAALKQIPALLRSYLALGGFVGDHVVIDRDLGTLHVFTGVEIARIPPARARALRRAAQI